jgi:hypothetical protein
MKKPTNKISQISQNSKKNMKIFGSNLEHGHKIENYSYINNNSIMNNNNVRTIHKLQEELNSYKLKSQKLEEEILQLNLKIKEITEKNNNKEEEKNIENNEENDPQNIEQLKKIISSTYYILIEIIELILNQKYKDKDKDNTLTSRQIENISMDIYEQSVSNDEDKKVLLLEQIQQILIFKLNFMNKVYKLNLDKLCEKIKQWNFNITKDINKDKDTSFNSFSAFSNNKKRFSNISMNNSDLALGIISPPRSPKFPGRKDSNSVISNIIDDSTIKDFSTSIIHYNYNNTQQAGIGGDSFFIEDENLLKSKVEIENKDQNKSKEVNLINTSFKDLSIIKGGDEPGLENISFTKNLDKYVANIEGGDNDNDNDSTPDENKKKQIFIKNDNQLNISFNDI